MLAQRLRQPKLHLRKLLSQALPSACQVPAYMHAGREKVGQQDHALCSLGNTVSAALIDGRLRQFKERGLHHGIRSASAQLRRYIIQVGVGFLLPAAVRNQKQSSLHSSLWAYSKPFYWAAAR